MDFQVTRLRCLVKKQLAIVWLISLATFAAVDPTLNSLQRAKGAFEGQHILALSIPGQRVTRCARRIHEWWAWRCVLLTFRRHSLLLPLSSDRSFPDRRGFFLRARPIRAAKLIGLGLAPFDRFCYSGVCDSTPV